MSATPEPRLRRLFLTGLLTLLPVWLTWVVVKFVFVLLSGIGRPLVEPLLEEIAAGSPPLAWLQQPWVMGALALLATIGVILFAGAPNIAAHFGVPITQQGTPLRFDNKSIDRRELASGSELFAVSGQVVNPTDQRQRVPDIRAELRDAQGRLVYSWTIAPQQRWLGPRKAMDFNSAQLDVPRESKMLELSFSGAGAG
jgi:hypothetical protein